MKTRLLWLSVATAGLAVVASGWRPVFAQQPAATRTPTRRPLAGSALSPVALWYENGFAASSAGFRERLLRMARNAKLIQGDLVCVLRPDVTVTVWREWRAAIETQTGTRLIAGLKVDALCANDPTRAEAWKFVHDCSRELWNMDVDRIVVGMEACFCYEGLKCWWIDGPGWDDAGMRRLVGALPAGPTYVVYPALVGGWGKCTDAQALLAEQRSAQWRSAWQQLPRVVFGAHGGLSGDANALDWRAQRLVNLVLVTDVPCCLMVSICSHGCPAMVPPDKAARLLHQAAALPQQTVVYVCEAHGESMEVELNRVAAARSQFDSGLP